jgi:hypothetical protein
MSGLVWNVLVGLGMVGAGIALWFGLLVGIRAIYRAVTKATSPSSGPWGVPVGIWWGAFGLNFVGSSQMQGLGPEAVAKDFSLFALIGLGIWLLVRRSVRGKNGPVGQAPPPPGYPAPVPAPARPAAGQAPMGRLVTARTPRPTWHWVAAGVGGVALLGLVVAGLVQAANAPAVSTAPPAAQRYHNDQQRFGITPPAGWVERPSNPNLPSSAVLFVGPSEGEVAGRAVEPIVNVFVNPAQGTLDDVVAAQRQYLTTNIQLSDDVPVTTAGGRPAHFFGGTLTNSPAGPLRMLQMLVVDGTKTYLVLGTTPEASFSRHEPVLRASLLSFTVG